MGVILLTRFWDEICLQNGPSLQKWVNLLHIFHDICGLYYKHITMIISDDYKWGLYYKCVVSMP